MSVTIQMRIVYFATDFLCAVYGRVEGDGNDFLMATVSAADIIAEMEQEK